MSTPSRSGVFQVATDARVERFTESVSFDRRLYAHDIDSSIAHAQMLAKAGLMSDEDCQQIRQTLEDIRQEIKQGDFEFCDALEDIHMHIEQALIDRTGDVGRRLHTARSRNDQVSTDMRLWTRDAISQIDRALAEVQRAFVGRCDNDAGIIVPAYTHLQRAQPVLVSHYWLAYCEKLQRDRSRLADAARRSDALSLGTGAAAGTTLSIDREDVAWQLGFSTIAANSLDASSDRDFVIEFAFALAMIAEHLSGWAEEWILWATTEFGYLTLPQQFCTCSSMMPQKINPDVLELIRGKTARVIGNLTSLLALVKGLPLAYNRDLQEDKLPLFDSFDTVKACLELAAPIVAESTLNRQRIAAGLDRGFLDATSLMEYMIARGVAQRTAHHAVGTLVAKAMQQGVRLVDLPLDDFQDVCSELDKGVYEILGPERAIEAFQSYGSTAPDQVADQLAIWKQQLST
ncbi:MAG: argininosuccinate lyase [Pirellulales bacterium]